MPSIYNRKFLRHKCTRGPFHTYAFVLKVFFLLFWCFLPTINSPFANANSNQHVTFPRVISLSDNTCYLVISPLDRRLALRDATCSTPDTICIYTSADTLSAFQTIYISAYALTTFQNINIPAYALSASRKRQLTINHTRLDFNHL